MTDTVHFSLLPKGTALDVFNSQPPIFVWSTGLLPINMAGWLPEVERQVRPGSCTTALGDYKTAYAFEHYISNFLVFVCTTVRSTSLASDTN